MRFLSENLEFINDSYNVTQMLTRTSDRDLESVGWCFVMRKITDGVAVAEYLIIDDSFNFEKYHQYNIGKRNDIISLIRERRINSIIESS